MEEEDFKRSYPELEGKIVNWRSHNYREGEIFKVKVVGLDYWIGMTLVDPNDPNDYYHCLNGPSSPQNKQYTGTLELDSWYDKMYNKIFQEYIKMIKNGLVDCEVIANLYDQENMMTGVSPTSDNCSFL